jgi:NTP pyrophosphatase (non-canonical NTP hydrolase)
MPILPGEWWRRVLLVLLGDEHSIIISTSTTISTTKELKMNFNEYQEKAYTTANEQSKNIYYMTMGMTGEAGEIANKIKKVMRDGAILDKIDIAKEIGDVLWYCAGLCTVIDISLDDVADMNIRKLQSRKQRGVLGGSGDNR